MIVALVIADAPQQQQRLVRAAAAFTILLGLVFVFVRAPHPFGWDGIDHYRDLALRLARGEPFPTTDVPWGYAYFLACFYRLAGDRSWVPLVAQVLLNGLVPWLLYRLVRDELGGRTAVVAAVLVALLSFNTVYASTQSSDSVCTVLFLASLAIFGSALQADDRRRLVWSGLLAGLAAQFRPNLILFPVVLAAVTSARVPRRRSRMAALALYIVSAGLVSIPWIVRNYRLTGELIPTSTHGGVQLWYGTLQTGPYLQNYSHNPSSLFEAPAFDYSSLPGRALVVSADAPCAADARVELQYWTDRDAQPRQAVAAAAPDRSTLSFTVPAQSNGTVLYYYFSVPKADGSRVQTPPDGANDPFVFFVDDRHLADLDRHGDTLDAFDLIRALRANGFGETDDLQLHQIHGKAFNAGDLEPIVRALLADEMALPTDTRVIADVVTTGDAISARFADGSTFEVPRAWSGLITDLHVTPGIAGRLCYTRRRMRSLGRPARSADQDWCRTVEGARVNDVFYLREPHTMRRYTALAWDNIRRAPGAFVAASAYRALRLFVVQGTSDASTGWQFQDSRIVYGLATAATLAYALAALVGVIVALRRGQRIWLLLTPVLYIPATICVVLTNMRYTVTVQPLLIAFIAAAFVRSSPATSTPQSPHTRE